MNLQLWHKRTFFFNCSHLKDTVHILFCFTCVEVVVTWYTLVGEEADDDVILVLLEEHDQGYRNTSPRSSTNAYVLHRRFALFRYYSHLFFYYFIGNVFAAVINVVCEYSTIISHFIFAQYFFLLLCYFVLLIVNLCVWCCCSVVFQRCRCVCVCS